MKAIILCLLILVVSACTTTSGRKIWSSDVGSIQAGVTTKEDIHEKFGPPASVSMNSDGRTVYTYTFSSVTSGFMSADIHTRMLQVLFDDEGVVEKHIFTNSAGGAGPFSKNPNSGIEVRDIVESEKVNSD